MGETTEIAATMPEDAASRVAAQRAADRRADAVILGGVSFGHLLSHFIYQSFLVMLPSIRDAFQIGPVQIGAIMTARELASGLVSLPGGLVCDRLRRHWGLVLAGCMAGFGLGWMIVGLAPSYAVLVLGMVLLSMSASLWHLPAMAALSQRFAHRRGTALSIHGVGGNLGDVLGPLLTGLLLAYLSWRRALGLYAIVPLLLAVAVVPLFRDIGARSDADADAPVPDTRTQIRAALALYRRSALWRLNLVAGLRAMCYHVYTAFLPLFLADELGFDARAIGLYIALLFSIGIVASPATGYVSDRLGRKTVLMPVLAGSALVSLALALWGRGTMLVVLLAVLGLFLRSDYSILSAMVLDRVGKGVATTTLGIMSFITFALGAISPLIAGALYARGGMAPTLYYTAGLFALATWLLATVRPAERPPQ
ncbi:MAG: MFS transporter [Chloroflexota bacterium]